MARNTVRFAAGVSFASALVLPATLRAATINVGPTDDYTKIEAAKAGDEVVIAPGTYKFRVHLTAKGTQASPIVIRAQDPTKPPVWDLSGTLVEDAPGSYTAGDRGRGCWQVDGGTYYQISGIVFTGCRTASENSAGIRYYNGAIVLLKDILFKQNDNGLTGGTQDSTAVVEFCEFDSNGNVNASAPTHNMYIYGGTFTLRFSYVHDSVQAENFHVRASNATLEYNWFARAKNYEGDLMTDDDFTGAGPFTQAMLVRGNVFVQAQNPGNTGQVLVVFNDTGVANDTMSMKVVGNTFVGNGGNSAFVHLSNADGTKMSAVVTDNVIFGTKRATLVESASSGTITGSNNWMATGGDPGPLTGTVFGASPGFKDAANKDFTLAAGSGAIGAAAPSSDAPTLEYFQNETVAREYRVRASAKDIGAFESTTTGPGTGPYGSPPPTPDGGTGDAGGTSGDGGGGTSDGGPTTFRPDGGDQTGNGAGPGAGSDSGCSCDVIGARDEAPFAIGSIAFGALATLVRIRRRPRPRR